MMQNKKVYLSYTPINMKIIPIFFILIFKYVAKSGNLIDKILQPAYLHYIM